MTDYHHDRLDTHEKVCAERYKNLDERGASLISRMDRLERIMISATGGTFVGMLGIIGVMLKFVWSLPK